MEGLTWWQAQRPQARDSNSAVHTYGGVPHQHGLKAVAEATLLRHPGHREVSTASGASGVVQPMVKAMILMGLNRDQSPEN